ncbi:hypothetical protein [Phenylobacterium sp.]|uniref:hypothetical protein n=1 Tax=Phenylobacterium sp. TaxID=1871053 RepID=UPI00289EA2F4|nr:hypothetical protein [Phenylobacterium sp.]
MKPALPRANPAYAPHIADIPTVFVVERDVGHRSAMAQGLRADGMNVIEFARSAEALAAVSDGGRPAILVITPEGDGLPDHELACRARAAAPRTDIVFTRSPSGAPPPGSHVLARPFTPGRLSRFIRLVVAKPALRSTLQGLYRQAHATSPRPVA